MQISSVCATIAAGQPLQLLDSRCAQLILLGHLHLGALRGAEERIICIVPQIHCTYFRIEQKTVIGDLVLSALYLPWDTGVLAGFRGDPSDVCANTESYQGSTS